MCPLRFPSFRTWVSREHSLASGIAPSGLCCLSLGAWHGPFRTEHPVLLFSKGPSHCLRGWKISDAIGSIPVLNYLVPALSVSEKDLLECGGGRTLLAGIFIFPLHTRPASPLLPIPIHQLP